MAQPIGLTAVFIFWIVFFKNNSNSNEQNDSVCTKRADSEITESQHVYKYLKIPKRN